jgi:hypothetical protein
MVNIDGIHSSKLVRRALRLDRLFLKSQVLISPIIALRHNHKHTCKAQQRLQTKKEREQMPIPG